MLQRGCHEYLNLRRHSGRPSIHHSAADRVPTASPVIMQLFALLLLALASAASGQTPSIPEVANEFKGTGDMFAFGMKIPTSALRWGAFGGGASFVWAVCRIPTSLSPAMACDSVLLQLFEAAATI